MMRRMRVRREEWSNRDRWEDRDGDRTQKREVQRRPGGKRGKSHESRKRDEKGAESRDSLYRVESSRSESLGRAMNPL